MRQTSHEPVRTAIADFRQGTLGGGFVLVVVNCHARASLCQFQCDAPANSPRAASDQRVFPIQLHNHLLLDIHKMPVESTGHSDAMVFVFLQAHIPELWQSEEVARAVSSPLRCPLVLL
jgi:hypothetical protein